MGPRSRHYREQEIPQGVRFILFPVNDDTLSSGVVKTAKPAHYRSVTSHQGVARRYPSRFLGTSVESPSSAPARNRAPRLESLPRYACTLMGTRTRVNQHQGPRQGELVLPQTHRERRGPRRIYTALCPTPLVTFRGLCNAT